MADDYCQIRALFYYSRTGQTQLRFVQKDYIARSLLWSLQNPTKTKISQGMDLVTAVLVVVIPLYGFRAQKNVCSASSGAGECSVVYCSIGGQE